MRNYEDDFTHYKKRAVKKTPPKSKHKHVFEPCVLEYNQEEYAWDRGKYFSLGARIDGYCPICGKIGPIDQSPYWKDGERYHLYMMMSRSKDELSDLGKRELDPATRTLPTFWIDDRWWQKFVNLEVPDEL